MAVAEAQERGGAPAIGPKGQASRARILACAVDVARRAGLDALSFGGVAEAAGLSKSAVVKHFGARADLQTATIDALAFAFRGEVIAPADGLSGAERLRRLYGGFLGWMAHGCPLAAAAFAGGDLSEALRARAASGPSAWRRVVRDAIEDAVALGQVDRSVEAEQASFELTGAALVYCQAIAALGDEAAKARAWRAFERALPAPDRPPQAQTQSTAHVRAQARGQD
jgi:AcrR family transcriptional regulator